MLDAVGLAREVQEPAVVDDPVDDRGGHMIITEDGTPLGKRQVRRQDETALFIGVGDDLEQQSRALGIDRQIAEFIDDQQPILRQTGQFLIQPVGVFRPPKMRNQGGGREESGGDTLLTGLGDQRAGQVCFPSADIAVEDQITTGVEEVQTAQLIPTVAGREADVGPVVTVEGLDHG